MKSETFCFFLSIIVRYSSLGLFILEVILICLYADALTTSCENNPGQYDLPPANTYLLIILSYLLYFLSAEVYTLS